VTTLEVATTAPVQAQDVTERVEAALRPGDALVWVSTPHTTAAVVVNEADPDLLRDLERAAADLLRPLEPFAHARRGKPNARAHLMAALLGRGCLARVAGGRLALGRHGRVLLVELDGPQRRRIELEPLLTTATEGGAR